MMEDFNLQDELTLLQQHNQSESVDYEFTDHINDPQDLDAVNDCINGVVDSITGQPEMIKQQQVFDQFRSLLKHSETNQLPTSVIHKLIDAILSGFTNEIDATLSDENLTDHTAYRSHRVALEMYAFLVQWMVGAMERAWGMRGAGASTEAGPGKKSKPTKSKKSAASKEREEFIWPNAIPEVLKVMSRALTKLRTERIWQTGPERDGFVSNCFMKPSNLIAESESHMKVPEIKMGVYKVICFAAKTHGQAFSAQMTIMQNLQYTEHLSESMADLVAILAKEFDYSQLGEEVLREIADKQFNAQDTKGPRSFSKFLIRLAETSPRMVLKQVVLLQKHLDSESYPMRNSILEVIGLLIRELTISDGNGTDSDPEVVKRQVEGFFELLFERFLDLNSYVRSKVVTVLLKTCDLPTKFPKLRVRLTDLAVRSLHDKSSQVRRNCISLLTKLILTHPYGRMHGGELCLSEWMERFEKLESELKVLDLPEQEALKEAMELMGDGEDADEDADEEEDAEEGEEKQEGAEADDDSEEPSKEGEEEDSTAGSPSKKTKSPKSKTKSKAARRKSDGLDLAAADQSHLLAAVDQDTLARLRLTKKYYQDAISFIRQIEEASQTVIQLVASVVKSEVLEAMEFFKIAYEYKVEAAEAGVKRMLHLIWSKDEATTEEDGKEVKGIRSRLIECYSQLYFDPIPDLSEKDQVSRVAKNVIELTRDATLAELTSLEQLLGVMMAKGVVSDEVITKLWAVYSTPKDIPRFQRRGAIIVLGMFAAPKPDVVSENIELLLKIGLGPHGKADLILAKYTCTALNRISGSVKKVKGSLEDVSVRLPMDSPVFTRLQDAIMHPSKSKEWFSMAEQALNTIYGLGDQPDALCSDILRQMTTRVFTPKMSSDDDVDGAVGGGEDSEPRDDISTYDGVAPSVAPTYAQTAFGATPGKASNHVPVMGSAFELSQLIFVAGHCAIKQLVHLELVERDIKRRKAEETAKAGGKSAAQDELDQVAGSTEDDIGDTIAATKEKELLYGKESLLAIFGPMASTIVSQPKIYRNSMLKTAATLALAKFMCVSAQFCEDNLMMLFRVFETSKEEAVRSNIVIALGDIAVCFSNIMDENSDRLYAGLHDKDLTVKKNTLMVLTHLILNGMIKVKGQLGEMAKCLEDEDKRISDLAHLFFTELSTKEKAIYNNLPDIISHLSSGNSPVDEETFMKSMRFIFTFVDKKKEAESIVEKLCQRFQMATEPRQWRDIAFCLSLLPFNSETAFKRLVEGLPFYQDKLHEDGVHKRLLEILTKARANKAKNEQDIKEFEDALEEHRAKGTEDQELQKKVVKTTKRKARTTTKAKATRSRRRQQSTPPSSPE
ncbi:hypothetical protein T439DRAFT_315829 [Meredithblackwellia eburnea MCA 4105]